MRVRGASPSDYQAINGNRLRILTQSILLKWLILSWHCATTEGGWREDDCGDYSTRMVRSGEMREMKREEREMMAMMRMAAARFRRRISPRERRMGTALTK